MAYYCNKEDEVYYYHGDLCGSRAQSQACLSYAEMQQSVSSKHLGSASWITNHEGIAVQHLQYLPYGEPYVNQRISGYSERFTFTGKERDEETGYGYFGARYMDHELMTMWLSVDPMSDKYPSISPYAYCAWNPVRLVDPDGREIGDYYTRDGKWVGHDKYNDKMVYVCDGVDKNGHPINRKDLGITHDEFREKAATVYGESSAYRYPGNNVPDDLKKEMFAIASVHEKNDVAYGNTSAKHNEYIGCTPNEVNGKAAMVTANAAVINALTGGFDYSYGATQWDGAEQALFPADNNKRSTGKWELHMNTMGWSISDDHYKKWKANVGEKFKAPQTKEAVVGKNKGKKMLSSTAVYCRTIFWEVK